MRIIKPQWITHDGMPIFSVDIHPDNSRFVTGGQGKDSGLVVIWNFAPVIYEDVELDENVPKMLCHIDSHLACVNCVRWSCSGKYLASAGDDKLVMIWKFSKYPQGSKVVFGSKGKVNLETWRCISTLRAHSGDILDLAWSPHDMWLATASVDNTVIIWDAAKLPTIVTVLKDHTGLVKGVTWDPIGKYLSSQSDDKSLRIWRTIDWQLETVITKPFESCTGTTAVLRHSWSPDGQYLVTAHAMNNCGPISQIIERDGWKYDKDYVGHRKAITCVRFNNSIVQKKIAPSNKFQQMCVCALGSRDKGISVWLTGLFRPLVVIESLFQGPVLDLSWSSAGHLLACSFDGSVISIAFSEKEIGKSLTIDQKNELYEKVYGTSSIGCHPAGAHIIENPDLLPFLDKRKKKEKQLVENDRKIITKTNLRPMTKQIETRTKDGRRRITPIYIPPVLDNEEEGPSPFEVNTAFSKSTEENRLPSEKKEHVQIESNNIINEQHETGICNEMLHINGDIYNDVHIKETNFTKVFDRDSFAKSKISESELEIVPREKTNDKNTIHLSTLCSTIKSSNNTHLNVVSENSNKDGINDQLNNTYEKNDISLNQLPNAEISLSLKDFTQESTVKISDNLKLKSSQLKTVEPEFETSNNAITSSLSTTQEKPTITQASDQNLLTCIESPVSSSNLYQNFKTSAIVKSEPAQKHDLKNKSDSILRLVEDNCMSVTLTPIYKPPNKRQINDTVTTLDENDVPSHKRMLLDSILNPCEDNTMTNNSTLPPKRKKISSLIEETTPSTAVQSGNRSNLDESKLTPHSASNDINLKTERSTIKHKDTHVNKSQLTSECTASEDMTNSKLSKINDLRTVENTPNETLAELPISRSTTASSSTSKSHSKIIQPKYPVKRPSTSVTNLLTVNQPRFIDTNEKTNNVMSQQKEIVDKSKSNLDHILPAMQLIIPTTVTITDKSKLLIIHETVTGYHKKLFNIKFSVKDVIHWQYMVGYAVIGYAFNNSLVAFTLENKNLYTIELLSGRMLFPPIALSATASTLSMNNNYLVCITSDGMLNMWNIVEMKRIVTKESMTSLLTSTDGNEITLKKVSISKEGIPTVTLSNGKSFLFSISLGSWVVVGDSADPITLCASQQVRQNILRTFPQNNNSLPLYSLQSYSPTFSRVSQNCAINEICTWSYLENQVTCAIALQSPQEFQYWLLSLVRFLLHREEMQRLRAICQELVSSMFSTEKTILGLSKLSLLKAILKEVGENIHAQRLFIEFNDQLNTLSSDN